MYNILNESIRTISCVSFLIMVLYKTNVDDRWIDIII